MLFVVFSLEVGDSPVEQIITALKHQLKKENTVVYRNRGVKERSDLTLMHPPETEGGVF